MTTDEMMPGDQPFAPADQVSVVLASGQVLAHAPVVHAKGSWQLPLSRDELKDKFMDCATRVLQACAGCDSVRAALESGRDLARSVRSA